MCCPGYRSLLNESRKKQAAMPPCVASHAACGEVKVFARVTRVFALHNCKAGASGRVIEGGRLQALLERGLQVGVVEGCLYPLGVYVSRCFGQEL